MFKIIVVLLSVVALMGCAQKTFFGKASDTLIKSPCASTCHASAFYVNGKWL